MASSHPNGNDTFHNNFFENNNYFSNLDPSLVNPQDSSEQPWSIQPNQLNIPGSYQSSDSQRWQDSQSLSSAHQDALFMNRNGSYNRTFNSTPPQTQNAQLSQNQFNAYRQPQYDRSIIPPSLGASRYGSTDSGASAVNGQGRTVAPKVLQSVPTYARRNSGTPLYQQSADTGSGDLSQTLSQIPQGLVEGKFLIISPDRLNATISSRRMHNFVNVGDQSYDVSITKSTIPVYTPRKSRNEIKRLLATDSRLSATINKKHSKHGRISAPRTLPRSSSSDGSALKGSVSLSDDSLSEDESSDGSDYESSEDEEDKSPLPTIRPNGSIEAVRYDSIKALWRPRSRPATSDDIRDGLKSFWELFQTIRDRWKSDSADVKQAEDNKKIHEVPLLKERVAKQREMAEVSLRAAMQYGHPDIIEHCGEIMVMIASFVAFLQERARESDYSGTFVSTILEFISRCKTLTEGALDKTNLTKVLPRFAKRGDKSVQASAKRIMDNAASRKRKETAKVPASTVKDAKEASNGAKPITTMAGVKRRVVDTTSEAPSKKLASSTIAGNATSVPKAGVPMKKPISDVKSVAIAPKQVIAKPTSFFSGLQSAAKKPGTSNAALAAAQAKALNPDLAVEKKLSTTTVSALQAKAAPAPAFSFAATMANLTKPKEAEPVLKQEDINPPETPEEKTRRVRKENRRKLRVSWKPDESLTAIKYFTHDPEEELGHDASQVRDVGDIGSEGRMLKEHRDMLDIDDDDEETSKPIEKPWRDPVLIDFSVVNQDELQRNYAPYGGGIQKPDSPESETQMLREANTLMAIYSSSADIPPTPKEAPAESTTVSTAAKNFGTPPDHILERLATLAAKQKGETAVISTAVTTSQPAPGAIDLSAIFGILGNQPVAQPPQQAANPAPAQPQQAQPSVDLESIFAKFAAPGPITSVPPQQQQAYQQPLGGVSQPGPGYGQPPVAVPTSSDLASLLASLAPQTAQAPPVPQMPSNMQMPMPPMPPMSNGMPDYSQQYAQYAWMQQMYQQQAALHQQSQQQPQQQQQQAYPYENEERRRWREGFGGNDGTDDTHDVNQYNKRPQKQQSGPPRKRQPGSHPPMFVVQCKYFNEGKCKKGADCTFRHDIL